MIRALYTATAGMRVNQHYTDTIGNNIANMVTTGYKRSRVTFRETLYDVMEERPVEQQVNLRVGNGVRTEPNQTVFHQGPLESTGDPLDLAIDGPGFFMVLGEAGQPLYTRNGAFRIAYMGDELFQLETRSGEPVLDQNGDVIQFIGNPEYSGFTVDRDGTIYIGDQYGQSQPYARIGLCSFMDLDGLQRAEGAYYVETDASGPPIEGETGAVIQGALERSNVELNEEITTLIMAQRAYQLNSRVLQSADEMEKQANNLR